MSGKNVLFNFFFFPLNLPLSHHFFSTAWGSAALKSPSLKAGTNLKKGWKTLSAVFLLVVEITGLCQEPSCPGFLPAPGWSSITVVPCWSCTALQKTKEWWLFFSAPVRDFTRGWCFFQPRQGRKDGARMSWELVGYIGFCSLGCG